MAKSKSYNMKLDKIRVTFPNGEVIEDDIVKNTFAKTIIRLGVKRVFNLRIWGNRKNNILLVDNHLTDVEIYKKQQDEIEPGYYLLVYNNTEQKAKWLEQISDTLHENLKVEIIKNHVKSSTPVSTPQRRPVLPTKPVTIQKKIVGQVEKADGVWRYNNGYAPPAAKVSTIHFVEEDDIIPIPFTDSSINPDVLAIRHEGKIGVYSLSFISTPLNQCPPQWICTTDDAFPYDEIRVLGMKQNQYGYIAFRKDCKWGIDKAYYSNKENSIIFRNKVKCDCDTFELAMVNLWRDPFE